MKFNNWNLEMDTFPVRQYDNLTRRLEVSGDIPDGWSWAALLSIGDNLNIISLQYGEPGLYVDLTADMIPYAGKYNLQLRATQGDKVRHTNIVQMQVNDSMSGDAVWPELPSEFSQAEQRITELNDHPPKPGDNGFWLTWNVETDQYEESDIPLPSGGGSGSDGGYYTPEVTQPSDGTMQVSFEASEDNMPPVEPVSVTLPSGPAGKDGEDGAPGLPGQDGYSPTVQTEQIEGGTRVTITDATGAKEFEVMNGTNGQDGQPGQDGTPGQDGFSPTASVTQTADGAKIIITDKSGTTNATITNGKDGTNGTDGQTPNITPGNIETLPAGSDVTASITGQTPNLVLNLGIPQGPAGSGVPSTDGVPTDYLLSPAGWVAPPSGGGGGEAARLVIDDTTTEAAAYLYYNQDSDGNPFDYQHIIVFVEMPTSPDPATTKRAFWIRYDDGHVGPDGAQYNYTAAANSNDISYGRVLNAEIQILELKSKCYISFSSSTGAAYPLYVMNGAAYNSPSKIGEVKFLMSDSSLIPAGTRVCIWAEE